MEMRYSAIWYLLASRSENTSAAPPHARQRGAGGWPAVSTRTAREFRQVAALDQVVGLEKDLAQPRLADRVVLEVELVEPMERVLVRVHVERVDAEVVGRQAQRLKHLAQREVFPVAKDDHVLAAAAVSRRTAVPPGRTHLGRRLHLLL